MNTKQIVTGVYGGLIGGVVFGIMMGMMGMLPMIGGMIGLPNAFAGFVLHMVFSAIIGAGFGLTLGPLVTKVGSGIGYGIGYGAIWWLLGPLTLMPFMMGMGLTANWSLTAMNNMLPSLLGHLIFGLFTGGASAMLQRRRRTAEVPMTAKERA